MQGGLSQATDEAGAWTVLPSLLNGAPIRAEIRTT